MSIRKWVAVFSVFASALLFFDCSKGKTKPELGPTPQVRIDLSPYGLPKGFFSDKEDISGTIIGYRFVVWLDNEYVSVGFNTSPSSRLAPERKVEGLARLLVFSTSGALKAQRDIPYLANGNGELVAEGKAMSGPNNTLLFEIQSVNLDPSGRTESKSGVLLLDAKLQDVARIDRFLEQTTFVGHALVFQEGFTLGDSRSYDILGGSPPLQIRHWQQDWPTDARDRKFGEHAVAYMACEQELRPNEYVSTKVVYAGAKQRCRMIVEGENQSVWEVSLKDGETAIIVGVLADGSVAGVINGHEKGNNAGRLVIWKKDQAAQILPWLPQNYCGEVVSATTDMSRYAALSTCDGRQYRWIVFDRRSPTPLVDRAFPQNARAAALSPDGLHYASFEAGELRVYSLPNPN
jgi:hypothetical protein